MVACVVWWAARSIWKKPPWRMRSWPDAISSASSSCASREPRKGHVRAQNGISRRAHRSPRVRVISRIGSLAIVTLVLVGCLPALHGDSISSGEWPNYGNDAGGTRYSPLTQIDRENVVRLRVAWTYRTGETVGVPGPWAHYAFEATPLMVDGTLFFSTPYNRVIAL